MRRLSEGPNYVVWEIFKLRFLSWGSEKNGNNLKLCTVDTLAFLANCKQRPLYTHAHVLLNFRSFIQLKKPKLAAFWKLIFIDQNDHFISARCCQFNCRRLHTSPLQVEGLPLQAHLQGAPALHVRLHLPLPHLQAGAHREPERVRIVSSNLPERVRHVRVKLVVRNYLPESRECKNCPSKIRTCQRR